MVGSRRKGMRTVEGHPGHRNFGVKDRGHLKLKEDRRGHEKCKLY